ncbi:MAG: hypothetical protein AAGK04_00130, partial [Planctomycetota bacterium]
MPEPIAKSRPVWVPRFLWDGTRRYDGRPLTDAEYRVVRGIKPSRRSQWLVGGAAFAGFMLWTVYLEDPVMGSLGLPGPLRLIVGFVPPMSLCAFAIWFHWTAPTAIRARRRKLREFDHPICARCGYDLSGGEPNEGACPECGADLAA